MTETMKHASFGVILWTNVEYLLVNLNSTDLKTETIETHISIAMYTLNNI